MEWEYEIEPRAAEPIDSELEHLNRRGAQGWELVMAQERAAVRWLYWKRAAKP